MTQKETYLISCPNCGGDDEPWFAKAEEAPQDRPYVAQCGKCLHCFFYGEKDVVIWPTMKRLSCS